MDDDDAEYMQGSEDEVPYFLSLGDRPTAVSKRTSY